MRRDNVGIGTLKKGTAEVNDNKAKAEILSEQFKAVFTDEETTTTPNMDTDRISDIDPVEIKLEGIVKLLKNINTKKANGPDGISCWVLKEAADPGWGGGGTPI